MKNTGVRRYLVAASALSLALVAGCDGSDGGADGKADQAKQSGAAGSQSSGPAAQPLTAAELKKAALVTADVDGFTVSTPGKGDLVAASDVSTAQTECVPLAHALAGVPLGKPSATEVRQVTSRATKPTGTSETDLTSAFDVTTTLLSLASYADGSTARKVLKSLTDAGDACAGGFSGTAGGEKQKITKVAGTSAPKGADEAVAFTVTAVQEASQGPMKLVVIRQGATVGYFTALNLASLVSGKDFAFPAAVVRAQQNKLG